MCVHSAYLCGVLFLYVFCVYVYVARTVCWVIFGLLCMGGRAHKGNDETVLSEPSFGAEVSHVEQPLTN